MTLTLFLLAVLPPILIGYYVYQQDKYEKEPKSLIIKSFIFGCISIIPVLFLEIWVEQSNVLTGVFMEAMIGVALIEEGAKFFFLRRYLFNKPDFNEPFDGIVYAVMISLGFATIENIAYVFQAEDSGGGILVGILRMFTAIPLHAACGVIMGYFVGLAKFSDKRESLLIKGLLFAVLVHGLYDYFLFLPEAVLVLSLATLFIAISYSRKAIKKHQENSPFK